MDYGGSANKICKIKRDNRKIDMAASKRLAHDV